MPLAGENRLRGTLVSILLHGLLVLALMFPVMMAEHTFADAPEGAGGPGPAGGGGGGSGGTGGRVLQPQERIQFIRLAPEPTAVPVAPEVVPPPVPVIPPPEPVVPPPTPPPAPPPPPPPDPVIETKPDPPAVTAPPATSVIPGVGGGTGNDGTAGNGPGSGGGVGSGIGTGRGSGRGPGTGGGPGTIYPPFPTQLLLPPTNAPRSIVPYHVVANFDVDSTGKVLAVKFNESKDGAYNKKLRAMLAQFRFSPATTYEGRPVRATAIVEFDVY